MKTIKSPATYEDWYHTPRGCWIGEREFNLLRNLLEPEAETRLLDVGCGTGHFSRRFFRIGLSVTGIDPDTKALDFAKDQGDNIVYLQGSALDLPFSDNSFDYTTAITSLCFIDDPQQALKEMWRVTGRALALGLLNRHSLLSWKKQGRGSYRDARWDTAAEVLEEWTPVLRPAPKRILTGSAILLPGGGGMARWCEQWLPNPLPWGGFLAVCLRK